MINYTGNATSDEVRAGLYVFGIATISSVALILNAAVFIISLRKSLVVGEYRFFLLNSSLCDFVTALGILLQLPLVSLSAAELQASPLCTLAGFLTTTSFVSSVPAIPLVSLNRYISMYYGYHYKKIYSSTNIFFILAIPAAIGFAITIPLAAQGYAGGPNPAGGCSLVLTDPTVFTSYMSVVFLIMLCSYTVSVFCSYKIHIRLQEQWLIQHNSGASRNLMRNKDLLKASVLQAMLPPICQIPYMIISFVMDAISLSQTIEGMHWLRLGEISLFLTLVFEPLVTLWIVKPYQRAVRTLFHQRVMWITDPNALSLLKQFPACGIRCNSLSVRNAYCSCGIGIVTTPASQLICVCVREDDGTSVDDIAEAEESENSESEERVELFNMLPFSSSCEGY